MRILVSGVRYRTASIEVREQFALLEEEIAPALKMLRSCAGIEECVILTTCNRTELYVAVTDTEQGLNAIAQFYRMCKGLDIADYRPYRFNLMHEDAVIHLFRVASGLDSLIIGEGQIMGQVKDALAFAHREKTAGPVLDKLFKSALSAGKRIRTETGIADKDVSVSLAAFHFAEQLCPDLAGRRIALVGGGKMAEILLSLLKQKLTPEQQARILVVNRSRERLAELTCRYGFQGVGWEQLSEAITHAEVLFVATGAPHIVLGKKDFEGQGEKLVIDIAVPRNVDPRVAELPSVRLYNTDDLAGLNGFSGRTEQHLREQAQMILEEESQAFQQWHLSLSIVPTLTRLREKVERIRQAELAASPLGTDYELVDAISRSLVRKILHDPTVRLKNSRNLADVSRHTSVLNHLFDIDSPVSGPADARELTDLDTARGECPISKRQDGSVSA